MTESAKSPEFLWTLFEQLRRRGFPLGIDDYQELRISLQAGFGWSSSEALKDLCNSLWAKSLEEQEILTSLFNQFIDKKETWQLPQSPVQGDADITESSKLEEKPELQEEEKNEPIVTTKIDRTLPEISLKDLDVQLVERKFIFVPQFPLTYREIAQTWRHLRYPVEVGALTELDVEETIKRRCQMGVPIPVVLKARRRNQARLLVLVDRYGSMTPCHRFCEEVCKAIRQAGRLEEMAIYYFHNVPAEGADEEVLEPLSKQLFPVLDSILPEIKPLSTGYIYEDPDLLSPEVLEEVLEKYANSAFVVIISDAGAISGTYNVTRLLDTISFFKALRTYTSSYVWLNPLPQAYWNNNKNNKNNKTKTKNNTAHQIARHVPMFPLDQEGIQQAVNVLRGKKYNIEKSL